MASEPTSEVVEAIHDVRRLHPWTLLHRFVVSLPGFVILLIPVVRTPSNTNWVNLAIAVLYGAVALPLIYLQYHRFRYWITPAEVVIHSGVLTRRRRNIPIERIQNIEIQRKLLPRLLGTASVKVVTAGSATAEGVLEYVSVREAARIREVIRSYQRLQAADSISGAMLTPKDETVDVRVPSKVPRPTVSTGAPAPPTTPAPAALARERVLVDMPLSRVLLSGVFRFSLLYIALIFSFLQFFEPDPEALAAMLTRGRFSQWGEAIATSPWLAGIAVAAAAALLSWISGILVNLNKYFRFRLTLEKDKLHKRHGLLTISEGTIPLKKVQTLICRSNPVMARFHWWILELQTMGLNIREHGYQVAAPFGRELEVKQLTGVILPVQWPDFLHTVSKLTIRRMFIRYSVSLLILSGIVYLWWSPAVYAVAGLPLVAVWAYLQYRNHGYAFTRHALVIRKGVVRKQLWYIPIEKMHVFYSAQSIFQRRLGLKTVYVDTAGASAVHFPMIVDIPGPTADELMRRLYHRFQDVTATRRPPGREGSTDPGTAPPVSSSSLPVPVGP